VGVLFIDFPLFLYTCFVGKESLPDSREILLGSLVSLFFLVVVGLHTNDLTPYKNFLLLSGLNTLYSLVGMLLYPKKRNLGILLLLPILMLIAYTLLMVFIQAPVDFLYSPYNSFPCLRLRRFRILPERSFSH
jgi:hypothetical protein